MADDTRTVQKDFNRRLLSRELTQSALPFEELLLAGFVPKNRFESTPAPAPRVIIDDKVANTQDIAAIGELRFVFTTALTGPEGTTLDTLLTNHVSTDRTQRQTRRQRDIDQLDELEIEWPNWDTFTDPEKDAFLKKLSRFVIRRGKRSAAF